MYRTKTQRLGAWFVTFALCQIDVSFAANWEITPAFLVVQHYSDNIFLTEKTLKQRDYVTELNPAIGIEADSRRSNLNFYYVMQNLFYQYNTEYNNTNNLLQLDANSELVKNNLFLDVAGSIDQQLVSFDQSAPADNINIVDRAEVRALSLSPYFVSDMGGNMSTDIRYLHGITRYDTGASDSITDSVNVNLASGREFTRFTWRASYTNTNEERTGTDIVTETDSTIKFENGYLNARYRLFNSISFLADYGYANNDYESGQSLNNGSYWAFGLGWRPNDELVIDAVYGSEYRSARFDWNPTSRTSLNVSWRDTDIGLNPGESWSGEFALRNRRTQWSARYLEETTTTQQIQVLPDVLSPEENSNEPPEPQTTFDFGLTDEVFIRKRGQLVMEYVRSKSIFSVSYFNETRIYQTSEVEQQIHGGSGTWRWNISAKTAFNLSLGTEQRQSQLEATPDDFQTAETKIEWLLKRPLNASLSYRYTNLDSDIESRPYRENRVIFRIHAVFSQTERNL